MKQGGFEHNLKKFIKFAAFLNTGSPDPPDDAHDKTEDHDKSSQPKQVDLGEYISFK
jgi:hypothetical protein